MMDKNVGIGSYYLWAYKVASGGFLDGAQNYKLRIRLAKRSHYRLKRLPALPAIP